MQKRILRIALPLFLALAGLAFASKADAGRAWGGSSVVTFGNRATIDAPGGAAVLAGDPDVPNPIVQPSHLTGPGIRRAGSGRGNVWLRVYLSRWFSR